MDQIAAISAAPHLPYSMRSPSSANPRPELIASVLTLAATGSNAVRVTERNGELFIDFATAA